MERSTQMRLSHFFNRTRGRHGKRRQNRPVSRRLSLALEILEDRTVPSTMPVLGNLAPALGNLSAITSPLAASPAGPATSPTVASAASTLSSVASGVQSLGTDLTNTIQSVITDLTDVIKLRCRA